MRKSLFLLTAVAAMMASCSNNEKLNIEREHAIGFNAYTGKTTRATIVNNNDLKTAGGFSVWGYKAVKAIDPATQSWTSTTTIFNKQHVTSSAADASQQPGAATNWTYTPAKYWDVNGIYCFYAAGPTDDGKLGIDITTGGVNNGLITITGAGSLKNTESAYNDYVIDRLGVKDREGSNNTDNVDFTFNHVMSKVVVALKSDVEAGTTIKVKSLSMTGWNNATGDFKEKADFNAATKGCAEWTLATPEVPGTATFTIPDEGLELTSTATPHEEFFIMVPQPFAANAITFNVTYDIVYEDGVIDPQEKEGRIAEEHNWATDCVTTYTLTIGPKPIKFDLNVEEWSATDGHELTIE